MLRVEVEDLTGVLVVQTLAGPLPAEGGSIRTEAADSLPATLREDAAGGGSHLQGPFGIDLIVAPERGGKAGRDLPVAGPVGLRGGADRRARRAAGARHRPQDPAARDRPDRLRRAPEQGLLPGPGDRRPDPQPRPPAPAARLPAPGRLGRPAARARLADDPRGRHAGRVRRLGRPALRARADRARADQAVTVPWSAALLADGVAAAQEVVVSPDAGANVQGHAAARQRAAAAGRPEDAVTVNGRLDFRPTGSEDVCAPQGAAGGRRQRTDPRARDGDAGDARRRRPVRGRRVERGRGAVARALRAAGLLVTLDYLGEDTTDAAARGRDRRPVRAPARQARRGGADRGRRGRGLGEADRARAAARRRGAAAGPNALGERVATEHLERIVVAARDAGTTVTIDAEDHRTTDAALRHRRARCARGSARWARVVQAALRRTEADVRDLAAPGVAGPAVQGRLRRARRRGVRRRGTTSTSPSRAACGS